LLVAGCGGKEKELQTQLDAANAEKATLSQQLSAMTEANKLVGTWRMGSSADKVWIKEVTPKTWTYMKVDVATARVDEMWSGTYELANGIYTETTLFGTGSFGAEPKVFNCTLAGNVWHHQLKDPPMYEEDGKMVPNPWTNIDETWTKDEG
jgi:hypothetical protein